MGVVEGLDALVDGPDEAGVVPYELSCAHTPRETAEGAVLAADEEGWRSSHLRLRPFMFRLEGSGLAWGKARFNI